MATEKAIRHAIVEQDNDERAAAGRPRSEPARKAILDATRKLLMHTPLLQISIESIARKAGVGKTTIYRWWPNKSSVAMEAFLEQPGLQHINPTTATAAEAIERLLENLIRQLRGHNGRIVAGIIAESQSDETVLDLLYEKFLKERVETLYSLIERGQKEGDFAINMDADIAIDMLLGPLFLRVLSGEHGISQDFAEKFPKQALMALKA
ncbi:MAG: TetR/AcrR family transcriptional regulator [Proteobacteria bacterium]|nr:TetR/AcrR family transcriptional regulator [Pseudomonadota bacterium]